MKQDSRFFDGLVPSPKLARLYALYEEMSPEQQAHAGRIGAQLWAKCDTLSPAGAFELTMAILNWVEENEHVVAQ